MSTKVKAARQQKREQAESRQAGRATLTTEQQLAALDARPGHSKKERARLTGQAMKPCTHLYYGPKEYGWSVERCVYCNKPKPKPIRKKAKP